MTEAEWVPNEWSWGKGVPVTKTQEDAIIAAAGEDRPKLAIGAFESGTIVVVPVLDGLSEGEQTSVIGRLMASFLGIRFDEGKSPAVYRGWADRPLIILDPQKRAVTGPEGEMAT